MLLSVAPTTREIEDGNALIMVIDSVFPPLSSSLGSRGKSPRHGGVRRHEAIIGQRRERRFLHHIQCSLLRRGRAGEFWDNFTKMV
ncbi:MAG: hypothetical protein PHQ81_09550 [Methanofollis sp.]|nr:hypothetical protein [Methanofollis sp.]